MTPPDDLRALLGSREFYELMQTYRHTPVGQVVAVSEAYEAVKAFLAAAQETPQDQQRAITLADMLLAHDDARCRCARLDDCDHAKVQLILDAFAAIRGTTQPKCQRCGSGESDHGVDGIWHPLVAHETPAARPAEDIKRIYELMAEFGVLDTDALKHRLEDHERWRKAILSGELRDTDLASAERPIAPHATKARCILCYGPATQEFYTPSTSVWTPYCAVHRPPWRGSTSRPIAATEPGAPTR